MYIITQNTFDSNMGRQTVFIYEVSTCNRRKLDAFKLSRYFVKNNCQIVDDPTKADIIILITCAYSAEHANQSLQMVNRFLGYDAELIVGGCLPAIEEERLRELFNGKTIVTSELEKIDEFFPENRVSFANIEDANTLWENINKHKLIKIFEKFFGKLLPLQRLFDTFSRCLTNLLYDGAINYQKIIKNHLFAKYIKKRWFSSIRLYEDVFYIRPAWGCLGNCSYCVIKKAIGSIRSKPLDTIISEFKNGLKSEYKNFVLDADDLGAYGIDIGSNLPELLDKLTSIPGDYKIHIRNIHPVWVVKYIDPLESILKRNKIQGFGSSIQSGNPRILKLMHRFSDVKKMEEAFCRLREACPDLMLVTECINGFPTETREEFKETLDFIKEIDFSLGYIFPFSSRPGTFAESLEPKISNDEIILRMKYAKRYLRKAGYNTLFLKRHNIMVFSKKFSTLDEGAKSFCLSTIG